MGTYSVDAATLAALCKRVDGTLLGRSDRVFEIDGVTDLRDVHKEKAFCLRVPNNVLVNYMGLPAAIIATSEWGCSSARP